MDGGGFTEKQDTKLDGRICNGKRVHEVLSRVDPINIVRPGLVNKNMEVYSDITVVVGFSDKARYNKYRLK